ncbi:UV radiation resistance associated protein [Apiospora aurea]|uniref:Autophagy-related protein 14 n=1 Tax=Apiospora aurea TaxID=335848 RepID=A0ABR1QZ86_9PEZI
MSFYRESTRPLLTPQNRRLRHLHGIYLRNLTFERHLFKMTDDVDLSRGSPNKLDALKNAPQLHHSASSDTLTQLSHRPPKPRRRSTNLANKSPVTRQKQLELAIESRAADVFFSLHVQGVDDPVYISEVGTRSTNFNFSFFELSQAGSHISRSSQVTVKVWAQRRGEWLLLLEELVDFRQLNFIGTLINHQFPPNCLVFHLIDGVYTLELPSRVPEPKRGPTLPTSSHNALMKLTNLEASIQDALATCESVTGQINTVLEQIPPDAVPEEEEKVKLVNKSLASQQRKMRAAEARRDQLKASIAARRTAIIEGRAAQESVEQDVEHATAKLPASRDAISMTGELIRGQRRRICEDLAHVFPITQVPSAPPLTFQICGLPLPNTNYDPTSSTASEDALSAALGYVAQVTHLLQFYLSVPIPYPITVYGSRSSVRDDISQIADTQRSFPLFLRGGATAQYRFEYGWFLLNKNIEALCVASGLKVVDIRHTLPNLKYLLYVCSAGTDELPERKRGGIRGLFAGKLKGRMSVDDMGGSSAGGSRRGSTESDAAAKQRDELRKALEGQRGRGDANNKLGAEVAPKRAPSPRSVEVPPYEEGLRVTLRTKGLRENMVQ